MTACRKPCCTILPQRWVFAVMGSLGIMNVLAMRVCLSLAITKIVTAAPSMLSNGTISHETCPAYESKSSITSIGEGYEWDEYTQGIILSSFFWGYIVTQLPGGILSANFGGKYVLGLGILSTALCTVWTPTVIRAYDATGLIVIRVLTGLGEGMTKPAVYALIGQWAPPHERSRMSSLVLAGTQLGTIVGTSLSGVLIQHSSIGWPMPFYVLGGIGITWFFVWVILGYNNPDVHPFITEKEKKFLHETMNEHTHRQTQPTPWRSMLTSAPLWAMVVAKFGREWGFQMMVTDLPKYMSNVLKFSIKANGFLTALPSLAMWTIGISSSWLADWLMKHGKLSRTNVRRIFVTISSLGPAIFMILASYAGCDYKFVVTLFTVSMGFMGSSYSGAMANLLDLSPNYSGIMGAVGTTVGGLSGMMVPYVVGLMTPNQTLSEWRIVFWITVMIFCTAALIFDLWGDGEVQYWNNPVSQDDTEKELERKEEMPIIVTCAQDNNKT